MDELREMGSNRFRALRKQILHNGSEVLHSLTHVSFYTGFVIPSLGDRATAYNGMFWRGAYDLSP
jgi:hypothetical protein